MSEKIVKPGRNSIDQTLITELARAQAQLCEIIKYQCDKNVKLSEQKEKGQTPPALVYCVHVMSQTKAKDSVSVYINHRQSRA